jgi:hypothetical protein
MENIGWRETRGRLGKRQERGVGEEKHGMLRLLEPLAVTTGIPEG